MIDPSSGEIVLDSGDRVGPTPTLHAFSAGRLSKGASRMPGGGAWTSFDIGRHAIGGATFQVTLRFEGSRLAMVQLFLVEPHDSASWDEWSEQMELARKAKHDAWLASQLGPPPWTYPWGRVESNYDARSGASLIVAIYK